MVKKANAGNAYLATGHVSVMCINFGLELAFISIDSLFVCSRLVVMIALHFGQSASNPNAEVYVESIHVFLA